LVQYGSIEGELRVAFILKYKDKDEMIDKEIRFFDRHSANVNMEKLKQFGHSDVLVENSFKGNYVGVIIRVIGFVAIIAGIIVGIVQGNIIGNMVTGGFNFSVALNWWVSAIIIGVLFIGFAEIVNLLDAIHKKMK
jgi:hypothetical protein